jgi:hypothetical protein
VAIDLDHLDWALGADAPAEARRRTVVLGGRCSATLCAAIRAAGVGAVALPGAGVEAARRYAEVWEHPRFVIVKGDRAEVFTVSSSSGSPISVSPKSQVGERARMDVGALPSFLRSKR